MEDAPCYEIASTVMHFHPARHLLHISARPAKRTPDLTHPLTRGGTANPMARLHAPPQNGSRRSGTDDGSA
jgi:hypothetical protein